MATQPLPFKKNDAFENKWAYDKLHHATTVIPVEHRSVHEGFVWSYDIWRPNFPPETTIYSLFQTGPIAPHIQAIRWAARFEKDDVFENKMFATLYEGGTVSALGVQLPAFNKNRQFTNLPKSLLYLGPTVTTLGTPMSRFFVPNSGYGEVGSAPIDEWVFSPNTNYIFEITNSSKKAADLLTYFIWYEINENPTTQVSTF